jgi:ABC-type branched-subunit amino acid transport system substrate-binding protein
VRGRAASIGLLALLLASCGLRVDPALRAQGVRGASGVGTTVAQQQVAGTPLVPGAPVATGGPVTAGGPVSGPAGAGPLATTGPVTSGATPAPPGGNGGATDVGVTGDSVTFGNVSTLSGPVPGLFAGGVYGTRAYFAYVNSQGGVYGRQLEVSSSDDQLDCGQNRARHLDLIPKVFAFAGSLSLYDNCGAEALETAKSVADVSLSFSAEAGALKTNFSVVPLVAGYRLGSLNYYKQKYPGACEHMATLYGNVGAAPQIWANVRKAAESLGCKVVYERGFTAGESDFTADVIQMRQAGVQFLYFISADAATIARVANTAAQQQWKPALFAVGAGNAAYDPGFLRAAGANANGIVMDQPQAMFATPSDAREIPGVALYQQWMAKIGQSNHMDLYSAWGWGQALLAVQALRAAGPHLTRAGYLAALQKIHQFDGDGMFAPSDPAGKKPATCYIVMKIENNAFRRVDTPPDAFRCDAPYYYVRS